MVEIINLNKKRKAAKRAGDAQRASENRVKHGRTKAEKNAQKLKDKKLLLHVESHKRETPED